MQVILAQCGPQPALFGDVHTLSPDDRERLLDDHDIDDCALCEPLSNERMAVGMRHGGRCTWWLLPSDFMLSPPNALWLEPALFSSDSGGQIPTGFDIDAAWASLPDGVDWAAVLACVVQAVRHDEPISIDVAPPTGRLLGMITSWLLGPRPERVDGSRQPININVAHPYRPALVAFGGPGFQVDPHRPPTVHDPVAGYVRTHLGIDRSAFTAPDGLTREWVAQRHDDGSDGLMQLLDGRQPLEAFQEQLLAHTVATSDPAPWHALRRRPAVLRESAVRALLDRADQVHPTADLVEALDLVYPRGASLAPWCAALLDWLRRTPSPRAVLDRLEHALIEWPQGTGPGTRASMWTEVVRVLNHRGQSSLALASLKGPVCQKLIDEGAGEAVAMLWALLPDEVRANSDLVQMVIRLAAAPCGDAGAAVLFRVMVSRREDPTLLLDLWLTHRGLHAVEQADQLRVDVWPTRFRRIWLQQAITLFGEGVLTELLHGAPPHDPLWVEFEAASSRGLTPLERLQRLENLEGGRLAMIPVARGLLADALHLARFPDPHLSIVARGFLDVPGASPLWAWLAVASARPGEIPDPLIDGTVIQLCDKPPTGNARSVALLIMERLALAGQWEPLDHARWLVRFAMAPHPSDFRERMAARLVHTLGQREDAAFYLASLVIHLLDLDPMHPALQSLFLRWLPDVWSTPPEAFITQVEAHGLPDLLEPIWRALVDR